MWKLVIGISVAEWGKYVCKMLIINSTVHGKMGVGTKQNVLSWNAMINTFKMLHGTWNTIYKMTLRHP